jgi:hypothetical protein
MNNQIYNDAKKNWSESYGAPYPETEVDYLIKLIITNNHNIFL